MNCIATPAHEAGAAIIRTKRSIDRPTAVCDGASTLHVIQTSSTSKSQERCFSMPAGTERAKPDLQEQLCATVLSKARRHLHSVLPFKAAGHLARHKLTCRLCVAQIAGGAVAPRVQRAIRGDRSRHAVAASHRPDPGAAQTMRLRS